MGAVGCHWGTLGPLGAIEGHWGTLEAVVAAGDVLGHCGPLWSIGGPWGPLRAMAMGAFGNVGQASSGPLLEPLDKLVFLT